MAKFWMIFQIVMAVMRLLKEAENQPAGASPSQAAGARGQVVKALEAGGKKSAAAEVSDMPGDFVADVFNWLAKKED